MWVGVLLGGYLLTLMYDIGYRAVLRFGLVCGCPTLSLALKAHNPCSAVGGYIRVNLSEDYDRIIDRLLLKWLKEYFLRGQLIEMGEPSPFVGESWFQLIYSLEDRRARSRRPSC